MQYDPLKDPLPQEWLAASEADRLAAVRSHHALTEEPSDGFEAHAAMHAIVETQLAQGNAAAGNALTRLLHDGLDRHDAIHAIASVVAGEIFRMLKHKTTHDPAAYAGRLAALTAASWRTGSMWDQE
jgi:hypothetical protein